ncbi:MAG: addiction module protein [Candidatus Latescibacterota bacterium]
MTLTLSELLRSPADQRAGLAMALWDSLPESQRAAELELMPDQAVELDRRWDEHLKDPESAVRWDEVLRGLQRRA